MHVGGGGHVRVNKVRLSTELRPSRRAQSTEWVHRFILTQGLFCSVLSACESVKHIVVCETFIGESNQQNSDQSIMAASIAALVAAAAVGGSGPSGASGNMNGVCSDIAHTRDPIS